jgi:hypothetical protein
MNDSLFLEFEFLLLVFSSFVLPLCLYGYMRWEKTVSPKTVFFFGLLLIVFSGVNLVLLPMLKELALNSPSQLDDKIFASAITVALYLVPAVFAGIGINLISHILLAHLKLVEEKFGKREVSMPKFNEMQS